MKLKYYIIIFFVYNLSSPSYAYFDPGTGSHIIQAILSFISLIIFYILVSVTYIKNLFLNYLKKIKLFFSNKIKSNRKS